MPSLGHHRKQMSACGETYPKPSCFQLFAAFNCLRKRNCPPILLSFFYTAPSFAVVKRYSIGAKYNVSDLGSATGIDVVNCAPESLMLHPKAWTRKSINLRLALVVAALVVASLVASSLYMYGSHARSMCTDLHKEIEMYGNLASEISCLTIILHASPAQQDYRPEKNRPPATKVVARKPVSSLAVLYCLTQPR